MNSNAGLSMVLRYLGAERLIQNPLCQLVSKQPSLLWSVGYGPGTCMCLTLPYGRNSGQTFRLSIYVSANIFSPIFPWVRFASVKKNTESDDDGSDVTHTTTSLTILTYTFHMQSCACITVTLTQTRTATLKVQSKRLTWILTSLIQNNNFIQRWAKML